MIKTPNFLIVGAAKCGTTTLSHALSQCDDIFITKPKEPKYFSYKFLKNGYRGPGDELTRKHAIKSFKAYCDLFANALANQIRGEASVDSIFYYKEIIPELKDKVGDPKIIIMLRNPVHRAYSAYGHLIRDGRETCSFEEGLKNESLRLAKGYEFIWSYRNASMYYEPVKAFLNNFSKVKIVFFEEFILDQRKVLSEVLDFLGSKTSIDSISIEKQNFSGKPKNKWVNKLVVQDSPIKEALKSIVSEERRIKVKNWIQKKNLSPLEKPNSLIADYYHLFENDIQKLENLINKDLSFWKI